MFYNKITKKENNKYGQMKLKKTKNLGGKKYVEKQKGYNPNRISSNNSCAFNTSRSNNKFITR